MALLIGKLYAIISKDSMSAPREAFRVQLVKIQPRQSLANSLEQTIIRAPRKAFRKQLVKIQPRQSLANSLEQTIILRKVTSVVKLMEWTIQGATKVKVLSPEIPDIIEVDIFHMMEDSMKGNDKASYHYSIGIRGRIMY